MFSWPTCEEEKSAEHTINGSSGILAWPTIYDIWTDGWVPWRTLRHEEQKPKRKGQCDGSLDQQTHCWSMLAIMRMQTKPTNTNSVLLITTAMLKDVEARMTTAMQLLMRGLVQSHPWLMASGPSKVRSVRKPWRRLAVLIRWVNSAMHYTRGRYSPRLNTVVGICLVRS